MSKVSELRKMFEEKSKKNNDPPIHTQPPSGRSTNVQPQNSYGKNTSQSVNTEKNKVQTEQPRVSVAEMKKNLEGKIQFNQITSQTNQDVKSFHNPIHENKGEVDYSEKIPSFQEAKANLMKFQEKKEDKKKQQEKEQKQHFILQGNKEQRHEDSENNVITKEQIAKIPTNQQAELQLRNRQTNIKRNLGNFDDF